MTYAPTDAEVEALALSLGPGSDRDYRVARHILERYEPRTTDQRCDGSTVLHGSPLNTEKFGTGEYHIRCPGCPRCQPRMIRTDATACTGVPMMPEPKREVSQGGEAMTDYRELLLQLCASLTLCEHMGDVSDDVRTVLNRIGIEVRGDDWALATREALQALGVTTLYGTRLVAEKP